MPTHQYHNGLRFRIALGLLLAVLVVLAVTSGLRYVSFRLLLEETLERSGRDPQEVVEMQLGAYARSRLILSVSTIAVILVIGDIMISRLVTRRLRLFLDVVRRVDTCNPKARVSIGGSDEITELAEAFNRLTENLQRQTRRLSTLNALAATVSQSLDLQTVLRTALDKVLDLVHLRAGWIVLRNGDDEFRLALSHHLPQEATLAHAHCDWKRCVCADVFQSGESQVFHDHPANPCPAVDYLRAEGLVFRACVPLKCRDRVLGVMSLAGISSKDGWVFSQDALATLTAIGDQIGVAVENASLYEELRETEALRRQLMERGIDLQEEERKRIARELHDQTSQRLTSILLLLGAVSEAESLSQVRGHIAELREVTAQTLEEVHDLALELRPSLLDDLGLLAALQQSLSEFRDRFHVPVDFQVLGLEERRLPPRVETALYRIAQEALTNVHRHAQASNVGVLLENRDTGVILVVEDDGVGFDVSRVMGAHVHEENLGLYGMRERASLLGGTLTIESAPGTGTSIFVDIPLGSREDSYGKDPHSDS